MNKILILAPHPDDGELSSGGSLKRWSEEGKEIWYVAFSPCNKSLPSGFKENGIYEELKEAILHLGIKPSNLIMYQFPVREFPKYRQEILEELILLKRKIQPDLVLLPNSKDLHQDHHQIHLEGIRAFKSSKLLGYELPWNSLEFCSNFHVRLKKEHIDAKYNALLCYQSQHGRNYLNKDFLFGLAKVRGTQVGSEYAEAFEIIRWIV